MSYISDITQQKLNTLLQKTFQMNSFADNVAYNFSFLKMINTEKIFHENFAHAFPQLADVLSDLMTSLEVRPVRLALNQNIDLYDSASLIFEEVLKEVRQYRLAVMDVIETADYNDDFEVKIALEEYLNNFVKFIHQVEIWNRKIADYNNNIAAFDHDFDSFLIL